MEDGIWVATACSIFPRLRGPGRVLDWTGRLAYTMSFPSLQRVIERAGWGAPDIIWTTAPGSSALKQQFPESKLVFHVVDYYPAFAGESIKRVEKRDYAAADLVFSIGKALSTYLCEELDVPSEKIVTLGQGAPLERYTGDCECPEDLAEISGPRAIYVGVLDKLDLELLESVARAMDRLGGSVVLIGPATDWLSGLLTKCSNVYFLGARRTEEVPFYIQNCDIGLMTYDRRRQDVYRGQNPLKLYEYAAAALPVISTPHDEFKYLDPPVWIVKNPEEVSDIVGRLTQEGPAAGFRMREFAEAHSWRRSVQLAEDALGKPLG